MDEEWDYSDSILDTIWIDHSEDDWDDWDDIYQQPDTLDNHIKLNGQLIEEDEIDFLFCDKCGRSQDNCDCIEETK